MYSDQRSIKFNPFFREILICWKSLSYFPGLYRGRLGSNWNFGWELSLQVRLIFFRWDLKTCCIKKSEYESQTKNDSDFNFYNFSLLVSYTDNFLIVCICILFSNGIYSPFPQIFLGEG